MKDIPPEIPPEILALLGMTDDRRRGVTFFSEVIRLVDRAGVTEPYVYKAIGLNRSLWYRMRDDERARTKKGNILKLVIVLQLSFWEAVYIIALAGYSFTPGVDGTDKVVRDCLIAGTYDPEVVDQMLYDGGLKALFAEE